MRSLLLVPTREKDCAHFGVRGRGGPIALALVALTLVGVACASAPPQRTLVLEVTNRLGRTIKQIQRKPCEDLELAFAPIEGSRLAPGESRGFVLPPTCVDLVAYDERGRVVGEQRGLRMLPGASWVLRR